MTITNIYSCLLWIILLLTGMVTSVTDIKERKIRNRHLIFFALAAIPVHIIFLSAQKTWPWILLLNTTVAALAGFVMFNYKIWRPGDAKLFLLYAFLMPPTLYEHTLPFRCTGHFINAFLAGFIFQVPLMFKAACQQRKTLLTEFLSLKTFNNLIYSFFLTSMISWATFPLFALFKIPAHNPFVVCIIFFAYRGLYCIQPSQPLFKTIVFLLAIVGLILQTFSSFQIFSLDNASRFLWRMIPLSIASQIINDITYSLKEAKDRVPFAPFLLIGALLAYTPFLLWLINISRR